MRRNSKLAIMSKRDLDAWLWQLGSELARMDEEARPGRPQLARSKAWEPRVDLFETPAHLLLRVELAGVRAEDVKVSFNSERRSICLRGVRQEDPIMHDSRAAIHQLEVLYGEFEREIELPGVKVLASAIRAHYANGFLTVWVPKSEGAG